MLSSETELRMARYSFAPTAVVRYTDPTGTKTLTGRQMIGIALPGFAGRVELLSGVFTSNGGSGTLRSMCPCGTKYTSFTMSFTVDSENRIADADIGFSTKSLSNIIKSISHSIFGLHA